MSAALPDRPNLDWLRKAAKRRLEELRAANSTAKLADAQLALARQLGFSSWRKLKAHVQRINAESQRPPAEEETSAFLLSVGTGQLDAARAMLDAAPQLVNAVGPHPFWGGRPQALHVAIETGRRDLFDLLLEGGADVNGTNDAYDDWSPVMLAIDRNRTDMRDELLRRGARIGVLEALMLGDDRRLDELLGAGPLPDRRPNGGSILAFGRTPFAIDRLLSLGATVDTKDRWGSTPIDAISRLGPRGRSLVRHMVARGVAAAPWDYARLGDLDVLKSLVDADPAVARLDSVMMAAVDFGHRKIVEWLLARGADVNARSDAASHHTALHSAAWNGDLEMVTLLVEAGADPAICDDQYGSTVRGWAETSIDVTNNPRCADVVAYLDALGGRTPR